MSLSANRVTIGTTATLIATGANVAGWVYLHAPSGGNTVYVGGSDVTTAAGLELSKGAPIGFWLAETDKALRHRGNRNTTTHGHAVRRPLNVLRNTGTVQGCGWHYR